MPKSWDGSVVSALDGLIKFLSGLIQKPTLLLKDSQQSRRNFDERVLSIFVAKMTAIFDFNNSGRLRNERNLYQGCEQQ